MRAALFILTSVLILSCSCKKDKMSCNRSLELISMIDLDISEPSGLAMYNDSTLLSVSDQNGTAYFLKSNGPVVNTIDLQAQDLEGVAYSDSLDMIYSCDESLGTITARSLEGEFIDSWKLDKGSNHGLEGCTLDKGAHVLYALKERDPGLLFVLDLDSGSLEEHTLDFAADYSGIAFDPDGPFLWIVSDESQTLSKCNLQGLMIQRFTTCIVKAEGVAISEDLNKIYIVSDKEERLYSFLKP